MRVEPIVLTEDQIKRGYDLIYGVHTTLESQLPKLIDVEAYEEAAKVRDTLNVSSTGIPELKYYMDTKSWDKARLIYIEMINTYLKFGWLTYDNDEEESRGQKDPQRQD